MKYRSLLVPILLIFSATAAPAGTIEAVQHGAPGSRPLIFVPGLASSATLWSPWVERFGDDFEIHVVGVRGFAELPASHALTIAAIADDLATYLVDQDLKDVVIIGHSVGGMIAMQTANQSDRVGELVLVDSLPFTAGLFVPGITPDAATAMADSLRTAMKSTPEDAFRAQQRAGLAIYTKTASFLPTLIEWSDASDVSAVTDIYTDLFATDYRAALATIDAPIHVLAAWDESMNVPREQLASIFTGQYAMHANTSLTVIGNTLHFIMVDQPDAFAGALLRVLGEEE